MSALVLTFRGSYLELLGWLLLAVWFAAIFFAAGWFAHYVKTDAPEASQ